MISFLFRCLFLFVATCLLASDDHPASGIYSARNVETFYGSMIIEEPVLLELIESESFQRLKSIHQYGVAYYATKYREEYTRYDHSLGVFAILRLKNASLKEQIAGLLHDVSHTVFSHVGDWLYGKAHEEIDYQNSIHSIFLEQSSLGKILKKYGFSIAEVMPLSQLFPRLEKSGPDLCADRIEYNIQGAYHQGFITYEEAIAIIKDLTFIDGDWVSTNPELMAKLGRFSLFMTRNCWGSAQNHFISSWLSEAIHIGVDLGFITNEDIHFGIDQTIWDRLMHSDDAKIQQYMKMILSSDEYYSLVDVSCADMLIKSKFRGIDPWILVGGEKKRLTSIDSTYCVEYHDLREQIKRGWPVKI